MSLEQMMASIECEEKFEWRKWMTEIPFINFPSNWSIRIIPPMTAAVVRFRVAEREKEDREISVYLDCYNCLGLFTGSDEKPEPYWEIYPAADGDVERYEMKDISGLLAGITESLKA
jgi:hypothetical protein